MYEAFYGFKEKPFSMLPDPGFLFLSKKHQTALTLLEYGLLNHVGFCVISGEPGAGKTTILRALLDRIDDNVTVGLITNTHQSFGGLLDWVLSVFDLHQPDLTHVEMHQILMEFLIEEYANNRTVLLVVDEAQNMDSDSLEELRMLSNVNSEKDQLLQVVLAGQPKLKDMLRRPELMQFAQRIAVDYHLDPLSVEETCGYIQHRLVTAGAQKDVFTPAACERIYNYSGGTPRLINLLCETVLVYGFADQQLVIDVDLVDEMVLERMRDSIVPIVNRDVAKQDNKEASKKLEENFPWIRPEGEAQKHDEVQQDKIPTLEATDAKQAVTKEPVTKTTITKNTVEDKPAVVKSAVTEKSLSDGVLENKKQQGVAQDKKIGQVTGATGKQSIPVEKEKSETPRSAGVQGSVVQASGAQTSSTQVSSVQDSGVQESGVQASSAQSPNITGGVIPPAGKTAENDTRKQFIKYGAAVVALGLILVFLALTLNYNSEPKSEITANDRIELRALREQEKMRLQVEADRLKEERDAALAEIKEEKRAKEVAQEAARQAVEDAAKQKAAKERAAKAVKVEQKKLRKEQARMAREKEKVREANYAAESARRKVARLEEEKRLKQKEEMRRAELEWLELQRQTQAKKS